ncbi:MAG: hypothetical protein ABJF11_18665 [Reichenbachiella sp.]|uniref:hypothetical protein n=1 Tax=Reichenbachiella sp. TaxID=2184521 RepID=UPI003264C922
MAIKINKPRIHLSSFYLILLLCLSIRCSEDEPAATPPDETPDEVPDETVDTVTIEDAEVTISENPDNGAVLATMSATTTSDEAIVFAISSEDPAGAMSIDATSGELVVLDSAHFDFEVNPSLTATISATSGEISASADVTITLTDVDETEEPSSPENIWEQVGEDIEGEADGDQFGYSTSLSADGSILAVGAKNNDGNGSNSGHARVYRNNGGIWSQIGNDIDGEAAGDLAGWAVSLSDDGTVLAVAAKLNGGTGIYAGHVRVYENVGDQWMQMGSDIDAESDNDLSGQSVCLSGDGSRVAIGGHYNKDIGIKRGHARVFEYGSGTWNQIGADIDGESDFDESGWSVGLNHDGSVVAVGAIKNDGNGQDAGHVRVFSDATGSWVQIGDDIDGEASKNQSGHAVSLSDDGSIIAIGAPLNSSSVHEGHVRVFENVSSSWIQIGNDIDGETQGSQSGYALCLNGDGTSVVIGAYGYENTTGQVRVFINESGSWTQVGESIDGKSEYEYFGLSTSISADGKIVAAGSPVDNGSSGRVKVYQVEE